MSARAGFNQRGADVLDYVRWVMVRKRDPNSPAPPRGRPRPAEALPVESSATPVR